MGTIGQVEERSTDTKTQNPMVGIRSGVGYAGSSGSIGAVHINRELTNA